MTGVKQGMIGRGHWFDYFGLAALILTPVTVMIRVLESVKRLPVYSIASIPVSSLLLIAFVVLLLHLGRGGMPGQSGDSAGDSIRSFSGHPSRAGVWDWPSGLYLQRTGFLPYRHASARSARQAQLTWREGLHLRRADRRDLHGLCRAGAGRGAPA